MGGYTKQGNTWYLNNKKVNVGDLGYDQYGNLNQLQSDGTWKTLQRKTKEGIDARKHNLFTPDQYKKWRPKDESTLISRGFQNLGLGQTASDIAELGVYFTPIGNYASLVNAGDAFIRGDWKQGLLNAVYAIPIIGNAGKIMKTSMNVAKALNKTKTLRTLQNVANTSDKVGRVAGYGLLGVGGYQLGNSFVSGIKSAMEDDNSDISEIKELYNQAKQNGYSDSEIKQIMGEDQYNQFQLMLKQ